MRTFEINLPELAYVAGTRGLIGVGVGLLASNYLRADQRKTIGLCLLGAGVLTTLPIAARIFQQEANPRLR